jgi:hypothetical protein
MGTYHEARAPRDAPANGERDVWFSDGKVKWGVWNSSTNQWDIEREEDYQGQTVYSAERLNGQLPSFYALATHTHEGGEPMVDTWHTIGADGEPVWQTGWAGLSGDVRYKKIGNIVYLSGVAVSSSWNSTNNKAFYLPDGYRPPEAATFWQRTPNDANNLIHVDINGAVRLDHESTGVAVYLYMNAISFAV